MSLEEYLYVDEKRLDSYIDQLRPPVEYDKVPIWKFGLKPMPSVEGQQARHGRPLTVHEKLQELERCLKKSKLLATPLEAQPLSFVIEQCDAYKVVGLEREGERGGRRLALWIAHSPSRNLCLLEGDRTSDTEMPDSGLSDYSALMELFNQVGDSALQRVLEHVSVITVPIQDPIGTLRRAGYRVGTLRPIRALYRVRDSGVESMGDEPPCYGVYGYPISIMAALP